MSLPRDPITRIKCFSPLERVVCNRPCPQAGTPDQTNSREFLSSDLLDGAWYTYFGFVLLSSANWSSIHRTMYSCVGVG
jgi:hypothetical protein